MRRLLSITIILSLLLAVTTPVLAQGRAKDVNARNLYVWRAFRSYVDNYFSGSFNIATINGIDYTPGSDTDTDLITVIVTGMPRFWWDEATDSFEFNKSVTIPGGSLKIGSITISEEDGDLEIPNLRSSGHMRIKHTTSPNINKKTGYSMLWADSNDKLYFEKSDGTDVELTAAGPASSFWTTGWLTGGQITINAGDNTKIDISAGSMLIITGTDTPVGKVISWTAQTALDPALETRSTWVGVKESATPGVAEFIFDIEFDSIERRTHAILGRIWNNAGTQPIITSVGDYERPAWGLLTAFQDFILEYGSWNISGNTYSANGTNLLLNKSTGRSFRYHAEDTVGRENVHTDAAQAPRSNYAYHLQGSSTTTSESDIDPDYYDNGGVKTALGNNNWSVQEVWYFPVSGTCHVLYGQVVYNSKTEALDAIITETKIRNTDILSGAILRAYLILEKGCTDLTNVSTAEIREAGDGVGGGGASAIWTRTGTVVSPTVAGDSIELSGNISAPSAAFASNMFISSTGFRIKTEGAGFIWDAQDFQRAGLIKQTGFNPEIRYLSSIPLDFRRVTAGTLLNPTTSDVALTLETDGRITTKNRIQLGTNGNVLSPGYTWADDTDTGLYRHSANTMAVGAGAAEVLRFSNAEIYASKRLKLMSGALLFSSADLEFGSGNSTAVKMTLDSSGKVGIGINDPSSILHIRANTPGTVGSHPAGQLIIQDPDDTVYGNVVITAYESDGAGNPDQQLWYLGSSSGSNSGITFLNRRNANLQLGTNGTARMTIDGAGNVGIGTETPDRMVHVKGSNANFHLERESEFGATFFFSNVDGANTTHWKMEVVNNGTGLGQGTFNISDDGTGSGGDSTTRFIIDENGNVGIGSTPPDADLHVSGNNAQIHLSDGSNDAWLSRYINRLHIGANNAIQFAVGSNAETGDIRMTILSNGRVGIGPSTPTSALQVEGLPVYANNAAAITGGLTAGAFYQNGSDPSSVCVVN